MRRTRYPAARFNVLGTDRLIPFPVGVEGEAGGGEHDPEFNERQGQEAAAGGAANAGRFPRENRVPTYADNEGASGAAAARARRRAAAERRGDQQ